MEGREGPPMDTIEPSGPYRLRKETIVRRTTDRACGASRGRGSTRWSASASRDSWTTRSSPRVVGDSRLMPSPSGSSRRSRPSAGRPPTSTTSDMPVRSRTRPFPLPPRMRPCDDTSVVRRAVLALVGSIAEDSTHIRQRRNGDAIELDVATGTLPSKTPFAPHGHLVRPCVRLPA